MSMFEERILGRQVGRQEVEDAEDEGHRWDG
jgi:hypothetical protein